MFLLVAAQRRDADLADGALHGRARLRARDDDAGARARGPERRPVRAARRRHLGLDALPAGRRLDRRLRSSARSSRTGSRANLARALPAGVRPPAAASPELVDRLPPAVHSAYVEAFADVAAARVRSRRRESSFVALRAHLAAARGAAAQERRGRGRRRELRDAARGRVAPRAGAHRGDARPAREPLARLRRARRARRIDLDPAELWLLARFGEGATSTSTTRGSRPRAPRSASAGSSRTGGSPVTGEVVLRAVVDARREGLAELLEGWAPEEHDEVRAMLDRLRARARRRDPRAGSSGSLVAITDWTRC